MQLDFKEVNKIIDIALKEDIGSGDITSNLTIDKNAVITAKFVTRENIVVSGVDVVKEIFKRSKKVKTQIHIKDGKSAKKKQDIITITGNARDILAYERVALNLLQHMSGIATLTNKFVGKVKHTKAKILDTRKTIPGLRILEKYAVYCGGGKNHRFGLYDGILIKDNHIQIAGSLKKCVENAKKNKPKNLNVEVECDTVSQVKESLKAGADIILLDNMSIKQLNESVKLAKGKAILEASGGVNIDNVKDIAETNVDFISIGALTHSARSVDIGLDIN
jgi:nicotinate-nucleotide pyrophosphorylase (carboxylating)